MMKRLYDAFLGRALLAVVFAVQVFGSSLTADEVAGREVAGWVVDLKAEDRTKRLRAAKTIGIFGTAALPELLAMCDHKDPSVRYWAASHLGNLGRAAKSAQRVLERRVKDDSRAMQMAVAYALARIEPSAAKYRKRLLEDLRSDRRGTACSAADFLGRLGPSARDSIEEIEAVRKKASDFHVKGATKKALRLIIADGSLEDHKRPTGGGAPREWGKGKLTSGPRARPREEAAKRPNILWISCEDISPNLGCYGDAYASTPNLDRLAAQGMRYSHAFTVAGVCAVNRTGMITGMFPISYGGHNMRSVIPFPKGVKCFPTYLRAAGYFTTNKSKTDYQTRAPLDEIWDRQGEGHSDWRERKPGQPFFSVINLNVCHESQIRHGEGTHAKLLEKIQPEQRHDPAKAREFLPPIYPKTPEALKDWAWYQDNISEMDRQAGEILKRLKDDGLAKNTIVVFWSDHGRGLPRGKRWIYDSGVHIPVIVRWPEQIEPGSVNDELVSTLDFAPTMLRLAGAPAEKHMQGRVFLGEKKEPAPEYLFLHRDRMDEAYELMRAARDHRFKYIRNYEPERTYAQNLDYMNRMPTLVDLRRMHAEGKLDRIQSLWFSERKPIEELYDVVADPHETVNLAGNPEHAKTLVEMRKATEEWQEKVGDLGLIPERIMMDGLGAN